MILLASAFKAHAIQSVLCPPDRVLFDLETTRYGPIVIDGPTAYLPDSAGGLLVFDVTNPRQPTLLTTYPVEAWSICIQGDTAFLMTNNGLTLLDVSNPADPQLIAQHPTISGYIQTSGPLVFRGDFQIFQIYDFSDPLNPVVLFNETNTDRVQKRPVAVLGQTLFVEVDQFRSPANVDQPIVALDISDPTAPAETWQFAKEFSENRGLFKNGLLLVESILSDIGSTRSYTVFNIDDPAQPQQLPLSRDEARFYSTHIDTVGDRLYTSLFGITIFDATNPESPEFLADIALPPELSPTHFAIVDDVALVRAATAGAERFLAVDLAEPFHARDNRAFTDIQAARIEVSGNRAVVLDVNGGVHLLDVTDPMAPAVLAEIPPDPNATQATLVSIHGELLFDNATPNFDTLRVISTTDPANPVVLGRVGVENDANDAIVRENKIYISSDDDLAVIDISDPSAPHRLGSAPFTHQLNFQSGGSMILLDNLAVVTVERQIFVCDIADPTNPEVLWSAYEPRAFGNIEVLAGEPWVANDGLLYRLDLSIPLTPSLVPVAPMQSNSFAVLGDTFVSDGVSRLDLYDLSDLLVPGPTTPRFPYDSFYLFDHTQSPPNFPGQHSNTRSSAILGDTLLLPVGGALFSIDLTTVCRPCPADLNADGIADSGDIQTFITLFLANDPAVDITADGVTDVGDIQAFVTAFLAGC